jgi:hypothetical protein
MKVTVKLVVFWHERYNEYCSYCPEIKCPMVRKDTIKEVINHFTKEYLLWELQNRNIRRNLKNYKWIYEGTSIIPPKFTDEEAVILTEKSYELELSEYQIVVINVELPEPI